MDWTVWLTGGIIAVLCLIPMKYSLRNYLSKKRESTHSNVDKKAMDKAISDVESAKVYAQTF